MSTPKKPPGNNWLLKWLIITAMTATALRPSISGRYAGDWEEFVLLLGEKAMEYTDFVNKLGRAR